MDGWSGRSFQSECFEKTVDARLDPNWRRQARVLGFIPRGQPTREQGEDASQLWRTFDPSSMTPSVAHRN